MAQKNKGTAGGGLDALKSAIADVKPGNFYIFYGEERYLLEYYLGKIREILVSGEFEEFNHKLFNGQDFSIDELCTAVDALPVFSDRTLVEVNDFDIFKSGEETKRRLCELFSELPDYVCLIFIFDTIEYSPDGRLKLAAEIKKHATAVEFTAQDQARLVKWIADHFRKAGKRITKPDAEYLIFITGGLMTALNGEIEKISAYARGEAITRSDIDAVVTPVPDAESYKLTDAVARGKFDDAAALLGDLFRMRVPPHKLIYGITLTMRQLLLARLCLSEGTGPKRLMELAGIRYEFQARNLLNSARQTTVKACRNTILLCAGTARTMNCGGDPESLLTELILRIAASEQSQ